MPLSPLLATWLVDLGHDAVHAVSIGLATSSDTQVIETARRERRTIVTADLDYPRLLASARSTEPSLILFRGGNWSEADVRTRMATLLSNFTASDIEGSILVVERERLRRRRLPLP
jgi:predicted nuclease of predicted toxin-antitoxin system